MLLTRHKGGGVSANCGIIHLEEENNTHGMDNLDCDVLPGLYFAEKIQARA